jgi:hypothetical protein
MLRLLLKPLLLGPRSEPARDNVPVLLGSGLIPCAVRARGPGAPLSRSCLRG